MNSRHVDRVLSFLAGMAICTTSALADCDPVDFIVQDVDHVVTSDETRTAFLLAASKEQFSKAKSSGGLSVLYEGLKGDVSYEQARTFAEKTATLQKLNFSRSY